MELLPPDDPWASYARTVVVIVRPGATNVEVKAAPTGQSGRWPWPKDDVLHILTAWDPGAARPTEEENRANQRALEAELRSREAQLWEAVGVDPVSGHREEGVAVRAVALDVVLDLGARYEQDAIFEWTPSTWAVVACRGNRRVDLGWTVPADR